MESQLYYLNAVLKHDATILTTEILEIINALHIGNIPESFLRDVSKTWCSQKKLTSEDILMVEKLYQEQKTYETQQYYKNFFCQHLGIDIWREIIVFNRFQKEFYVKPIVDIMEDLTLTDFQKERKINGLFHQCAGVIYDKEAFFENSLSFDEWKLFLKFFPLYSTLDFKRLVFRSIKKKQIKLQTLANIVTDFSFFSYKIQWKNILITPSSTHLMFDYFQPRSHYEDNVFFHDNSSSHQIEYVDYQNNKIDGNTEIHSQHYFISQQTNWKDYILDVPIEMFSQSYLNEFEMILHPMIKECNLFQFPKWKKTLRDSLRKIHNIVGRLHPDYNCCQYHLFLKNNFSSLETKHIFEANDKILFPQLQNLDKSFQEKFEQNWIRSFDHFEKTFLFKIETQFDETCQKPANNFKTITISIPEMNIFQVIHGKNYKFFKKNKVTCKNEYNIEKNFIKNIFDEMYFQQK